MAENEQSTNRETSQHDHPHTHNQTTHIPAEQESNAEPQLGQQTIAELQMIQQQLDEIQKITEAADEQLKEIATMSESLDSLELVKPGSEILVPVVRGMFARATLTEINTLKVNVGSDIIVDKTLAQAREMLENQMMEVAAYKDQIESQRSQLIARAHHLGARITQE